MAYAVSVFFDTVLDAKVRSMWQCIARAGGSSFLTAGPYNPHLTLAIYERLDVAAGTKALAALSLKQKRFAVDLAYIGVFTGEENTVFLAATMTRCLFDIHQQVHSQLEPYEAGSYTYYLPGRWNPHCSIARQVKPDALPVTLAAALQEQLPVRGMIESLGLVETPSERELDVYHLQLR